MRPVPGGVHYDGKMSALMTVEEFQKLQDPPGAYYELRHGAAVARTRPKWNHTTIQERLRELVRSRNVTRGIVRVELPYRPVPEHELWVADVAYARRERCAGLAADVLRGAPDLVIEVRLFPGQPAIPVTEIFTEPEM